MPYWLADRYACAIDFVRVYTYCSYHAVFKSVRCMRFILYVAFRGVKCRLSAFNLPPFAV